MRNKIPLLFGFLLLFSIFFIPLTDTDFGWHLRCGQMIVQEKRLCEINTFTTLLAGYRWYSPSHLYQLVIYAVYQLAGFAGLSFFYAVSAALVFLFFVKSLKGDFWLKLTLLLPTFYVSWLVFYLGFRSQILSLYFFAIFLTLTELSQKNIRYLYLTPLLTLIWANSHPGFFLGPLLVSLATLNHLVRYLEKRTNLKPVLIASGIFLANLAASLINPFGYHVYQEVWQHSLVPLNRLIAEWVEPYPWQSQTVVLTTITLITLLLIHKSRDVARITLLILTTYLALKARRNLPLFFLAAFFALFNQYSKSWLDSLQKILLPKELVWLTLGLATAYFTLINIPLTLSFNERTYCQKAVFPLPCLATEFLKNQEPGNIFNAYEWGGYLIWQLPQFKIFVDGRMPSWVTKDERQLPNSWRGLSPYTVYLNILETKPGWSETLENYQTDYLLIQSRSSLDIFLEREGRNFGYQPIYRDPLAVVYRRV